MSINGWQILSNENPLMRRVLPAVAPISINEIVVLGGVDEQGKLLADAIIFNVETRKTICAVETSEVAFSSSPG